MGEVAAENALKRKPCCCQIELDSCSHLHPSRSCSCWFDRRTSSWNTMFKSVSLTLRRTVVPLHQMQLKDSLKSLQTRNTVKFLGFTSLVQQQLNWSTKLQTIIGDGNHCRRNAQDHSLATQPSPEVMYEAFADVLGLAVHSPKKK